MLTQPPYPVTQIEPNWFTQLWRLVSTIGDHGTTAQRPVKGLFIGRMFFDDTLGKSIWWKGSSWVDASGASV